MKFYCLVEIILFICLKEFYSVSGQQQVDDKCTVTATRAAGTCKILQQCQSALDDLRFRGVRPTVCGFLKLQQIVCCPNTVTVQTSTQKPLTDTEKLTKRYKKCVEYSSAVYQTTTGIALLATSQALTQKTDKCGHTAVPLIVGGAPASSREFPHSTLLGYQNEDGTFSWDCGGSLVSPRYVLTAGHCLYSRERALLAILANNDTLDKADLEKPGAVKRVRLGDLNLNSDTDDATPIEVDVAEIIKHPEYISSSQYNDIALLKLAKNVTLTPYIRPICLPTRKEVPGKAIATGWGRVEWAGPSSNTLLKVTLEIYSQKDCNDSYAYSISRKLKDGIVEQTQLCAGSKTEAKDTCQGDSGGPLQIYHPEIYCMYVQTGVTSFGRGCGTIDVPGVYTRISNYVDWLESVIWPNADSL